MAQVTIGLKPETREMLRDIKVHPKESFNDVLERLIQEHKEGRNG